MTYLIDAVFEQGVFRPLAETKLADGQRVRLVIEIEPELSADQRTIDRLMNDLTFSIPSAGKAAFRPVEPIQGTGIPASSLLVEDQR